MEGRLFLGVKVGSEHMALLRECPLTKTMHEEKTYYGFSIPASTSLLELKSLEDQLLNELSLYIPDVRWPTPLLFSQLLIG